MTQHHYTTHPDGGATGAVPVDPDTDVDVDVDQESDGPAPPVHHRPASLALVFAGGTVGVAAREALTLAFPTAVGSVPWVIFGINLSGAFLLGVLLDALARRGSDHGRRRTLRLLLGTGLIGGYTTYSALATDTALLIGSGSAGTGVGYGLGTVFLGGIATWTGILIASLAHRPRTEARS